MPPAIPARFFDEFRSESFVLQVMHILWQALVAGLIGYTISFFAISEFCGDVLRFPKHDQELDHKRIKHRIWWQMAAWSAVIWAVVSAISNQTAQFEF
jgi:hypothetical protein